MNTRHITFIGAGNMARSIIAGLSATGYPSDLITVTAPSADRRDVLASDFGVHTTADNRAAATSADVLVLAVKPQLMAQVCEELTDMDFSNTLVISIAAGVTVQRLKNLLNDTAKIVRVMPNTPALIGQGMSGLFADTSVSETDKAYATCLLEAVGKVCWVNKESDINCVIAAAGSAPAYFFLFMQAIQEEAMKQGFDQETARLLVQQTALGAAEMVIANPNTDLSTLREQVTSKGGTTAEAIRIFSEQQLNDTVASAMRAAVARAEEMEHLF